MITIPRTIEVIGILRALIFLEVTKRIVNAKAANLKLLEETAMPNQTPNAIGVKVIGDSSFLHKSFHRFLRLSLNPQYLQKDRLSCGIQ